MTLPVVWVTANYAVGDCTARGGDIHTSSYLGRRVGQVDRELAQKIAQKAAEKRAAALAAKEAAEAALSALLEVATDVGAQPRDRVKASEAILDRCGITPQSESSDTRVGVTVDVDFDERLARIVAASASSGSK